MAQLNLEVGQRIRALLPDWIILAENLPKGQRTVQGVIQNITANAIVLLIEGTALPKNAIIPLPGNRKVNLAFSLIEKRDIRIAVVENTGQVSELFDVKAPANPYPYGRIYVDANDIVIKGTPFEYLDRCKSVLGGSWDKEEKFWRYPATPSTALNLFLAFQGSKTALNDEAFLALVEQGKKTDDALDIKFAEESELQQPAGLKTRLWLHQLRASYFASAMPGCGLFMDMGTGKASQINAPVLTPTGWKRMGDVRPGDAIINSQGTTSHVVTIHPQGVKPIFRVTFSDGASTRVTGDHLWAVYTPARKYRGMGPRILTTNQIAADLRDAAGNCKHYIPMVKPVEFAERELPIAPYLLGVLLGDGSLSTEYGSIILTNPESEIIEKVGQLVPPDVAVVPHGNRGISYRLSRRAISGNNSLLDALRNLGLMGTKSATKFIPEPYLFASCEQRAALLQGLLDTDGYVDPRNARTIEYVTVSEALKNGVVELVQSLGGTATVTIKIAPQYTYKGERRTGQDAYRVSIALPNEVAPFRLPRKAANVVARTKYHPTRAIVNVEPDGEEEAQCITVDAPDHLYVTDAYILTHNSLSVLAYILMNNIRYTLVIAPKSVVEVWPDEWETHVEAEMRERFVVCALPFGSVAKKTQTARAAYEEAQRTGKRLIIIINYDAAYTPPFGYGHSPKSAKKSFAFQVPWDLLVVDEAQKIKKHNGVTAKFCHKLASVVPHRLVLTGTPMPHDPSDIFSLYLVIDRGETFGTSYSRFMQRYALMGGYKDKEVIEWLQLPEIEDLMYRRAFRVTEDVNDLPPRVFTIRHGALDDEERRVYDEMEAEYEAEIGGGFEFEQLDDPRVLELLAPLTDPATERKSPDMSDPKVIKAANVLARMMKLSQMTSGFVNDENGEEFVVGHSKVNLLLEVVEELKHDEPIVIFARFTRDIAQIKAALSERGYKVAELSGQHNDWRAWRQGKYQVIVVQLRAGGVGINFTKCGDKPCKYCIYYGKDFDWGNYKQSIKRIHRPGQTETTIFITLVMRGTIDEKIEAALKNRGNLVEAIVNAHSFKHAERGIEVTQTEDDSDSVAEHAVSAELDTWDAHDEAMRDTEENYWSQAAL